MKGVYSFFLSNAVLVVQCNKRTGKHKKNTTSKRKKGTKDTNTSKLIQKIKKKKHPMIVYTIKAKAN